MKSITELHDAWIAACCPPGASALMRDMMSTAYFSGAHDAAQFVEHYFGKLNATETVVLLSLKADIDVQMQAMREKQLARIKNS